MWWTPRAIKKRELQHQRPPHWERAIGLTITVDIGGLKVAAGVVNEDERILARVRQDIPAEDSLKT
jgi:hypothetical protein